jgi:hypothetical protein
MAASSSHTASSTDPSPPALPHHTHTHTWHTHTHSNGSALVKEVREKKDKDKSRLRFWDMAGSKMGQITGLTGQEKQEAEQRAEEQVCVACWSVWLSGCLAVWLSGCLSVCLSVWLAGCLAGCLAGWRSAGAAWRGVLSKALFERPRAACARVTPPSHPRRATPNSWRHASHGRWQQQHLHHHTPDAARRRRRAWATMTTTTTMGGGPSHSFGHTSKRVRPRVSSAATRRSRSSGAACLCTPCVRSCCR